MDPSNKDLGSVLAHVETLQKQLAQKESELRESKDREVILILFFFVFLNLRTHLPRRRQDGRQSS